VGDELLVASTLELGKKLVTEMRATKKVEGHAAVWRGRAHAAGAADVLSALADPLVTDSVLSRGIGLADARKEVAELVAFVRTLGTARIELDVTAKEYRLDAVWELKK
jgi:glycine/D-amino acid oxidase-like deaminating enzyme